MEPTPGTAIPRHDGTPYCYYLTAMQPNCGRCGQPPTAGRPIHCLGAPYHCLVHTQCLPLFDYEDSVWPHPHPFVSYTKRRINQP